jgi:hypothetical protein
MAADTSGKLSIFDFQLDASRREFFPRADQVQHPFSADIGGLCRCRQPAKRK